MPIEIIDCDDGIGNIIVTRGMVTDQELIDSLERHLTHDVNIRLVFKFLKIVRDTTQKI